MNRQTSTYSQELDGNKMRVTAKISDEKSTASIDSVGATLKGKINLKNLSINDVNDFITYFQNVAKVMDTPLAVGASVSESFGAYAGAITLSITGGVKPYSVSWDNGLVGESISNLSANEYLATIVDFFGVTTTLSVTVP